ncbi:MAG: hypothetical protein ABSH46_04650 [Bryobacteraceae bacterium]
MYFESHRVTAAALLLAAGLALPAVAQAPAIVSADAHFRWLQAVEQSAAREDQTANAEREKRQREFNVLLVDFTKSWNKLIQLSGRGGWNAKEARKTREAFERLVRCQAWIEDAKASGVNAVDPK